MDMKGQPNPSQPAKTPGQRASVERRARDTVDRSSLLTHVGFPTTGLSEDAYDHRLAMVPGTQSSVSQRPPAKSFRKMTPESARESQSTRTS
ncbi:unnamed protein product [Vitrella brassicaformis CCMP3155]|uniref:Uncharacterized protein n=1 Tax=Vitrella brassicaformis (strain CCMP3155) TaxID=1169540 RepID=A0A0G4GZY5_VITBC|nr:unnamed protein product [Vitrella brassicaformis CCMP3155]|eukprot:CEM36847.1 unnamed protein product [Vitrella brassicaformis CCMP3155]